MISVLSKHDAFTLDKSTISSAYLTEKELMDTIFPHPTLSEMMHESVLDAYQQVIHI